MTRIGIISDTHGLLRSEAVAYLNGCDLIIHGGDIGSSEILSELGKIALVRAVRGNVDTQEWCGKVPHDDVVEIAGKTIYILHDLEQLDLDPKAAGFDIVVSGHSHIPKLERRADVWYLNPGSAGRRRFKLPISIARLGISGEEVSFEIRELSV
jgi:putative phosphoesterase